MVFRFDGSLKQFVANYNEYRDPRSLDFWDVMIEGLRKAGMPKQ
jgi:hypothetical protein